MCAWRHNTTSDWRCNCDYVCLFACLFDIGCRSWWHRDLFVARLLSRHNIPASQFGELLQKISEWWMNGRRGLYWSACMVVLLEVVVKIWLAIMKGNFFYISTLLFQHLLAHAFALFCFISATTTHITTTTLSPDTAVLLKQLACQQITAVYRVRVTDDGCSDAADSLQDIYIISFHNKKWNGILRLGFLIFIN